MLRLISSTSMSSFDRDRRACHTLHALINKYDEHVYNNVLLSNFVIDLCTIKWTLNCNYNLKSVL